MPWELDGNAIAETDFLGTTNAEPVVVKTNNNEAMRVDTDGKVGIGTQAPVARLDVIAATGVAVRGEARDSSGFGVAGVSEKGVGVLAKSIDNTGIIALSNGGIGSYGESANKEGMRGLSHSLLGGVVGLNDLNDPNIPVLVGTYDAAGVIGQSSAANASGVFGLNRIGTGVTGDGFVGVKAIGHLGGVALVANGNVDITGMLTVHGPINKSGGGFRIDHPTDPANKYLNHSFVESPERKNVYDGIAVLDRKGEAEVKMPAWFDAVNRDFRYQLTAVGAPGPNLYIARALTKNSFRIAGGTPGAKVSWQVTGIRKDPWAQKNPITVEERKSGKDRGRFLDPALYQQPQDKAIRSVERPEDPLELMKKARRVVKTKDDHPGFLPAESKMAMGTLRSRRPKQ